MIYNINMKQKILPLILLLIFTKVFQVQAQTNMTVDLQNGTQQSFAVSSLQKITFSGGNMLITEKNASEVSLAMSSVDYISFDSKTAGIDDIAKDVSSGLTVYPNPSSHVIYIKRDNMESAQVCIYGLDGIQVLRTQVSSSEEPVDISKLSSGFYILQVNGQAFKFRKQ